MIKSKVSINEYKNFNPFLSCIFILNISISLESPVDDVFPLKSPIIKFLLTNSVRVKHQYNKSSSFVKVHYFRVWPLFFMGYLFIVPYIASVSLSVSINLLAGRRPLDPCQCMNKT